MQRFEDAEGFMHAWQSGLICLHPTDTIPGISFRPDLPLAWDRLRAIKGRQADQTCIALAPDFESAMNYWQKLPDGWHQVLAELWPAPLSVIWLADKSCPSSLCRADGSIALRVPLYESSQSWMIELMRRLGQVFPTTSVNRSGEAAAATWQAALDWMGIYGAACAVPAWVQDELALQEKDHLPSTLIRIVDSIDKADCYQVLREGIVLKQTIDKVMTDVRN